jgi:uncharacterized membrane protein
MNAESFSRRILLSAATAALALGPGRSSAQSLSAAEDRAIQISRHESRRQFSRLYDLMHPDAKAIIPREVVIGWYRDYLPGFDALGELTVRGIRVIDWTWEVTGVRYPNTAEVSFVQPFTQNGVTTELEDVVRLVPVSENDYRWFFGRTAEFVDEQIRLYARPAGTGEFTIHRLGVLPGLDLSTARVVNANGVVAGDASPFGNPGHRGFLHFGGELHAIDDLFELQDWINYARDINEFGVVVGGSSPFEGTFSPYAVSRSDFFELPKLEGHNHTIAHGINDAGTIVGEAFSFYFDGKPSRQPEAVIWPTQNEIETLPVPASTILSQAFSVNDNGWIIGVVALDEPSQASERVVVWRGDLEQRLEFLPLSQIGPGNSRPFRINTNNTIVGITETPATIPGGLPWIWRTGDLELTPLPLPAGIQYVSNLSLNDDEVVVGTGSGDGVSAGLVWRDGEVARLSDLIDTGSFVVTEANDISGNGMIAGQVEPYGDPRARVAALISGA